MATPFLVFFDQSLLKHQWWQRSIESQSQTNIAKCINETKNIDTQQHISSLVIFRSSPSFTIVSHTVWESYWVTLKVTGLKNLNFEIFFTIPCGSLARFGYFVHSGSPIERRFKSRRDNGFYWGCRCVFDNKCFLAKPDHEAGALGSYSQLGSMKNLNYASQWQKAIQSMMQRLQEASKLTGKHDFHRIFLQYLTYE